MKKTSGIILKEYDYAIKKIYDWYHESKSKVLTIKTIPFNLISIFQNIILEVANVDGKILYIHGGEDNNNTYEQVLLGNNIKNRNCVDIVNYRDTQNIKKRYDLIIFDDISSFSNISKETIRLKYEKIEDLSPKIILYTIEQIIKAGEKIEITCIYKRKPFVEPRFITTRIDLNKDIPYLLYEYLNWFIENDQKIIFYVPNNEKLNIIYEYYSIKLKIDEAEIYKISKFDDKKIIDDVLKQKNKATIIITDCIEANFKENSKINAIVLFAENPKYTYKKFLYLCGEIGRVNTELPEVLFVSKEVTSEMDKVKSISSGFNKKKWERKSLRY